MKTAKKKHRRQFSANAKELAVQRMTKGESVTALAREYGVERSRLYDWKDRWETGLPFSETGPVKSTGQASGGAQATELEAAYARIAELEQKIGRQEMTIDFFKGALRQLNRSRQDNVVSGEPAYSGTSKE